MLHCDKFESLPGEQHNRFVIQALFHDPELAEVLATIGSPHVDIFTLQPGSGHDLHVHSKTDVIVYVPQQSPHFPNSIEGLWIVVGNKWYPAEHGKFYEIPAGMPHDVVNKGSVPSRIFSIQTRPIALSPTDVDYQPVPQAE